MIEISDLIYTWQNHERPTLQIKQLQIGDGEKVFLHGPSGSGKSTLLGLLAGITPIQQGSIKVLEQSLEKLSSAKRDRFRADHIGTIFQNFNLLPYLSPLENVTLGCEFSPKRRQKACAERNNVTAQAHHLLNALGLDGSLLSRSVSALSIGQQQRVAAARAFIGQPEVIIADEPTSALDADTREAFITTLFEQAKKYQATVIFVSHDKSLSHLFDRKISLPSINEANL
ncbi:MULTISPECIES: ABC transporter ATP-binding protein [Pseudoalteromonas]|uniref:Methionine ABC transporter ATP-binding protein n=1 Tax=Pseudoalteromonas amylolytica TaxID=1859457 RepID=A0A1S1MSB5_9GAMM|nr:MULTISPECIES: ABC transporter ATP-binding protein [Pseudoalteromonas]OHU86270.1 methionine ABC transporter ATP-binding protein [Pseudoalteromonas sp. JW3]OHU89625.1 methionine ABC transporter ATP-binding protein [Pseudoalteromonas amylolytica]